MGPTHNLFFFLPPCACSAPPPVKCLLCPSVPREPPPFAPRWAGQAPADSSPSTARGRTAVAAGRGTAAPRRCHRTGRRRRPCCSARPEQHSHMADLGLRMIMAPAGEPAGRTLPRLLLCAGRTSPRRAAGTSSRPRRWAVGSATSGHPRRRTWSRGRGGADRCEAARAGGVADLARGGRKKKYEIKIEKKKGHLQVGPICHIQRRDQEVGGIAGVVDKI